MIADIVPEVAAAMRAAFPDAPALVADYYARMDYHLGWRNADLSEETSDPGKLVRPLLAILACEAMGGQREHALPLAAGLQLLHDFSLVHDDIEDQSSQRRGRATVWTLWGLPVGINVGDGMFALAHRAIHRLADVGVDATTTLAVLRDFEDTILRICEGQHLDIMGEGRFDVTPERYLAMIDGKTAALLAAATKLGGRLATDDPTQLDALHRYGRSLGLAFQIQDDLLDIWGDPARTGKPRAADLLQRKLSLPVIHGLAHATADDRAAFERIYRQAALSDDDVATLLAILDRTETQDAIGALMEQHHQAAEAALAELQPANREAFEALQQLTASLLRRRS